ncbi:MAG: hypothetical protein LUE27_00900 [Clostridia bacterium]|nr:hypothetical protein [Clostridia bacterium]
MNELLQISLCEMQAELFQLSVEKGYDSRDFIEGFMKSNVAKGLDSEFSHTQWVGSAYLMDRLEKEDSQYIHPGECYSMAQMEWIGYLYRYWHFYTGESSKEIYRQANAQTMRTVYLGYHTLSNELAIIKLKETYTMKQQRRKVNKTA